MDLDIEKDFVKDDIRCVMEQVAPDGSIIKPHRRPHTYWTRYRGAWFILHEAKYRNNDPHLINLGCRMLDYCGSADGIMSTAASYTSVMYLSPYRVLRI